MLITEACEIGVDTGRGNLLGLQPCLFAADYATEAVFVGTLGHYFEAARRRGWLGARTVVVLPEYLGTWLAATGEGRGVLNAGSLDGAMRALALRHPLRFLYHLLAVSSRDRMRTALFGMQGARMAGLYQRVFSRLAAQYGVTVVAGSILLPAPSVRAGVVVAGRGPVQNVSAVFGPDGRAHPDLARKLFPIQSELPFVTAALPETLPAFDTPAGRLGVLVCADSWHPVAYARLLAQDVRLVAVPSAIVDGRLWDQPWGGYDGAAPPADVDPRDVGALTEGQAWRKYALGTRWRAAGSVAGMNVFLRGGFWDTVTDGHSLALGAGGEIAEARSGGAALLNVWL